MAEETSKPEPVKPVALLVRMSVEQLEQCKRAAAGDERPVSTWARRVLLKAASAKGKAE